MMFHDFPVYDLLTDDCKLCKKFDHIPPENKRIPWKLIED